MLGTKSLDLKTAAVIIRPESIWTPIQAIRQEQANRWLPHITLTHPFLPGI
jgi:hypothetical protein